MNQLSKLAFFITFGAFALAGCGGEPVVEVETEAEARALLVGGGGIGGGARCSTRQVGEWVDGQFIVTETITTGCADDEFCMPIACTRAIPPSCFGFCRGQGGSPFGR